MGELSAGAAALLVAAFEADWFGTEQDARRFEVVRMSGPVIEDAARLAGVHGQRAHDSVQLATARAVRAVDPDIVWFVAFDRALSAAAAAEGFAIEP
jgi:hypothetical protein